MNLTNKFLSLVTVSISILVAIVLSEIFLRILGIGYGNAPIEASQILHHVHPKNYKFRVHDPAGEYGGFNIVYDNFGYRIDESYQEKAPNPFKIKIYFLGDSFTEAAQLSWSDTFVGRVESDQKIYVRNMGVSSYSPIFYLVQLRKELADLSDVDVVLQLYENDFDSDSEMILKANSDDLKKINSINGGNSKFIIKLLRYSYTARLIRKVQLQTTYFLNLEPQYATLLNQTDAKTKKIISAEKKQLSLNIISQIKEFCDARSINLHLMIIPNKEASRANQCCKTDLLHKELKIYALSENISFIDLADEFQRVSNQKDLFFARDIHLTSYGNEVTYLAIKKHLNLNN